MRELCATDRGNQPKTTKDFDICVARLSMDAARK